MELFVDQCGARHRNGRLKMRWVCELELAELPDEPGRPRSQEAEVRLELWEHLIDQQFFDGFLELLVPREELTQTTDHPQGSVLVDCALQLGVVVVHKDLLDGV